MLPDGECPLSEEYQRRLIEASETLWTIHRGTGCMDALDAAVKIDGTIARMGMEVPA